MSIVIKIYRALLLWIETEMKDFLAFIIKIGLNIKEVQLFYYHNDDLEIISIWI